MTDFTPPSLYQRHYNVIGRERTSVTPAWTFRQYGELFIHKSDVTLNFQPTNISASKNVARLPRRHRKLRKSEDASRKRMAHITLDSTGARRRTNQAQRFTVFAGYRSSLL